MMKDQYANYVVQKILEICTENQREMLLSRISVHLNALKKYTYGKHIVARFEQLYGEGACSVYVSTHCSALNSVCIHVHGGWSLHFACYLLFD